MSVSAYVLRSYAPKGSRPHITLSSEVSARLYLASAITESGELVYMLREQPFTGEAVVDFLELLLGSCAGNVMVIWDNASIHDCAVTHLFLSQAPQPPRLHLAKQPKYCPQLNADEQVWSHLKYRCLKNTCFRNRSELKPRIIDEMEKLKNNPSLIKQFFHHPDLGYI